VIAIILVYPHYDENPPVITAVLVICGVLIQVIGNDEIIVYEDKVVKTNLSFWAMLFRNNKKTIFLADIKKAYSEQKPKPGFSEVVVAYAVLSVLNSRTLNKNRLNKIYFELNDGSITKWLTDLDSSIIDEITEAINSALQKNIKS